MLLLTSDCSGHLVTLPAPPIRCFALTLCALQIVFTITITILVKLKTINCLFTSAYCSLNFCTKFINNLLYSSLFTENGCNYKVIAKQTAGLNKLDYTIICTTHDMKISNISL